MNVGSRIKEYRERDDMSQEELALKIFVSRQTISNWETSKSYPDIKSLSLLSYIFHVTLDEFIKGDIEEMKRQIDSKKVKEFNLLGTIYFIELLVLVISAYPLFKYADIIGVIVWVVFFLVTLGTAILVERFKENNDIQTYKEIIAFCEGVELTHDEVQQELGKRFYQKVLFAIVAGVITLAVIVLIKVIIDIV